MAVYVTPWGTVEFKPTRENRGRDVFIMQDDMWGVGILRSTKNEPLAKTGDNEKRQVAKKWGVDPNDTTAMREVVARELNDSDNSHLRVWEGKY
jgi:hypothetical protein